MTRRSDVTIVLALLAAATVAILWSRVQAQAPADQPAYAVVDIERALDASQLAKDVQEKLDARTEQVQSRLNELSNQLQLKQADLTALDPTSDQYYKVAEAMDRLQVEAQTIKEIEEGELSREKELWFAEGYKYAMEAVETIAKRHGLDMVFYHDRFDASAPPAEVIRRVLSRRVLYARPTLDLTDELIKELDAQYGQRGGKSSIKIGL